MKAGESKGFDTELPSFVVEDYERASITVTASYITQTIDGLEDLLKIPFGCGEHILGYSLIRLLYVMSEVHLQCFRNFEPYQ